MNDSLILMEQLKSLKLHGMAEAFNAIIRQPVQMRPSLETAISKMIETEIRTRDDSRTQRLLKAAKLAMKAHVEDVICSVERNLTNELMSALSDCSFVRNGENLLITGLAGCGKSFLACAFGHQACTLGYRTLYCNMNHFVSVLKQACLDGTTEQLHRQMDKVDLLILDDFGMQTITADVRQVLFTLVLDRYEKKSLIITSQLPFASWYDYIAENTMADAMLDRLSNGSHHIELKGYGNIMIM